MGRGFTSAEAEAERHPDVVVISHGFWQQTAGWRCAASSAGRSTFNGRPYTVLGVLPATFRALPGYGVAPEVYLPLSRELMPDLDEPRAAAVELVGRLHDGQSMAQGQSRARRRRRSASASCSATSTSARCRSSRPPAGSAGWATSRRSAHSSPCCSSPSASCWRLRAPTWPACCSRAARSGAGRSPCASRSAPADRGWCSNSSPKDCWLALFGTAGGLLLMFVLMRAAVAACRCRSRCRSSCTRHSTAGCCSTRRSLLLLTTMFSALAPALQATRPSLVPALKQEEPRYAHRRWTLRGLLVIGQVAVALVLLLTALLFLRNLNRARRGQSRVRHRQDDRRAGQFRRRPLHARDAGGFSRRRPSIGSKALPNVEQATYAHGVPLTIRSGMTTGADLRAGRGRRPVSRALRSEPRRARLLLDDGHRSAERARLQADGSAGRPGGRHHQRGVRPASLRRHRSDRPAPAAAGRRARHVSRRDRRHRRQQPSSHDRRDAAGGHVRAVPAARQPRPLRPHPRPHANRAGGGRA